MVRLELSGGGEAELTSIDGERVSLRSDVAFAPGSRLEGTIVDSGKTLRVKVHRCVRDGERFDLAGRCIDLTRQMRQWLAEQVSQV